MDRRSSGDETRSLPQARAPAGVGATNTEAGAGSSCQHLLNRADHALEVFALALQLLPSGRCQRVIAGTAVIFGGAPLRLHPAVQQEPLERRIKRALTHDEEVFRDHLQMLRDAVAVFRAPAQRS